ncbi:MAG TPA: adenosylcobinamide-phosphate synthase CbiB [Acidimicrobiales bacterium]|nr:adenosylcobinamide-phosphate synthase CbiB [Acidimicrobiales bacterium]
MSATAAGLGVLTDRLVADPPDRWHPVAWFGTAMGAAERRWWRDSRAAGCAYAVAGIGLAAVTGAALGRVVRPRWAATLAATVVTVGGASLDRAAAGVGDALDHGDLPAARAMLPALVGRDPTGLDEGELARAVVESVAENTVDAVVAPLLWAAVGGPAGAFGYRAVNTLDAMVGHRSARHRNFGWAAARLDDGANLAPARLTALAVAALRPRRAAAVWRAVRADAPAHPSPNAGVAEAAFAAALGLRLGGVNRYDGRVEVRAGLGDGRPAAPADIAAARALARQVGAVAAALGVPVGAVLDLSASLNPFAPDPAPAVAAHLDALGRYPDPQPAVDALAGARGVDPAHLVLTNGGAEAIALLASRTGGRVVEPDFSLYPRGGGPVWRSNPNNPTGVLAAPDERADVWDEAFWPMATGTWTRGDHEHGATVVGSLTKLLACPGLRVGYLLSADADVVAAVRADQPAWAVNGLAADALPDLLAGADLPAWREAIDVARADLAADLTRRGLRVRAGRGPWVLVDDAGDLRARLITQRVVVRDCTSFAMPGTVRIAVPRPDQRDRLRTALDAALGDGIGAARGTGGSEGDGPAR